MGVYTEWMRSLLPAPLAGRWGRAWAGVVGDALDDIVSGAKLAVKAGMVAIAPDDALVHHGADRSIPGLPGESFDSYRARLVGAWETWSWATTERGLRSAILLGGFGAPTFYTERQLHRPPDPDLWARFTVVFTGRFVWDGGTPWDSGEKWDGRVVAPIESMDPADVRAQLRTIFRTWKSARDRVTSVIIARGAWLWDTGDTWDSGVVWDAGDGVTELAADTWDSGAAWDAGWPWDYFL